MSRVLTALRYSFGIVLACGSGILLALALGSVIRSHTSVPATDTSDEQHRMTAEILEKINTIEVGASLPDHLLADLRQEQVLLSNLVDQKTLIVFFDPDCGGCRVEMENLSQVLPLLPEDPPLIMISTADPNLIEDVRLEFGLPDSFLYDSDGEFTHSLELLAYPFNVIVDENMVVQDVIAGALAQQGLRRILEDRS